MIQKSFKRKLTAILSADVVGYSRLMGEDDIATVHTLGQCRETIADCIEQYRGRVVDSPGDNLLAEFNSAVDAVRCAVEIQKELAERNAKIPDDRKMQYRIGVNLGDVIQEDEKIYGDGINLASRLEALAEPGGICISGVVYDQVKNKTDLKYQFVGKKKVKNVKQPLYVYRVFSTANTAARGLIKAKVKNMAFSLPSRPSIAVMPFTNLSGDSAQNYIGDGISENIITALSVGSGMFVIARNSTFVYKDRAVKVQQVAEELGVQYVLEGSIQTSGNRLRVVAQLIDALSGYHLWSEKYDRQMGELFDLQDEITKKIVVSLQVELTHGEQARMYAKTTDNLEAWSYGVKGNYLLDRFNKEDNAKARELFKTAIELDPGYVLAYVWLGATHALDANYGWSDSAADSWKQAHKLVQQALSLDDKSASVHTSLGLIYLFQGKYDKAVSEGKLAIELDPNFSIGHAHLARTMFFLGRFTESIELMKKAIRLSPYYPAFYLIYLGRSYAFLRRYEEAMQAFNQLIDRGRKGECPRDWGLMHLAEVYAEQGLKDEARALMAQALDIRPGLSSASFQQGQPFKDQTHLQRELGNLKKAGLP